MRRRLFPVLLLLLPGACAGRAGPPPRAGFGGASGSDAPAPAPPAPVASVGSTRLTKGDLADFVYERLRERWWEAVDEMVDERLVALEATRLGIVVPPAILDAAVEAEAAARGEQLRARFGDGADLAQAVQAYYGLSVAEWKRTILRPRLATHLALERVVRLSARTREQVVARVIVVADRPHALAIRGKLDQGADFSLTALEESEDPSKARGGVIPAIARGDLAVRHVEDALFTAAPGTVVGPLEVVSGRATTWHLYKVVERVPAWAAVPEGPLPRLEADLRDNPVTRSEYDRWAARARRTYDVRVFAPDGSVLRPGAPGR